MYAPSQWVTTLHCKALPHWQGAYTKWSLQVIRLLASKSEEILTLQDMGLKLSDRSEIWHVSIQQCCQCTCRVKQFSMQLRDFARSCVETTVHFVNRGPDVWLYTDGVSVVGRMLLSQVTFLGAKEHMIQVTPNTDTESISITQGWFKVCAEPMRDGVTL